MELVTDMKNGLEVLEPFLNQYDFKFDCFEYFKATSGQFTLAKYKNSYLPFIFHSKIMVI